jgi:glutamate/tyrosine decarboxylase-like PLP-dependent enzyme
MTNVLEIAAAHAATHIDSLGRRPIAASASLAELRRRLGKPLPETGMPDKAVIDELVRDADGGILGSGSGRFFGWVIGGALPVAVAADWLTAAWDQNAASNATAPAEAVVEEVCGEWAKELFGLPASASFAFVTGCQMAHTTALAAARHKLLADRGWDVERSGLAGAQALRILTTENRHESIIRSARLLGLGSGAIDIVPSDNMGRMEMGGLEAALARTGEAPAVVCLQAGDLNTGVFDPFTRACAIARAAKAWVHIDGAIGLWVASSERYRHLLDGAAAADSWATDAHKWLNVPFDSGLVFVAHAPAHRAAFSQDTSYSIPHEGLRNQKDWNPEWSRRGRAFPVYAAIRALGRKGIADLVERCCAHADRLVRSIGALPGAEVAAAPTINQGLVRFLSSDGDHDRYTDDVIRRIQARGIAWFGGVTWRGMRVMRVSVSNWRTTDEDIDRTIASVKEALAHG